MLQVANNVGYNPRTLDGRNTFYGMGIICTVTPAFLPSFATPCLQDVSTEDFIRPTEIERKTLLSSSRPLALKFIELNKSVNASDPPRSAWAATWLLTFDQLLYWKSIFIKEEQDESCTLKKIVLRIGGFHQMISLIVCIGYIMKGSGLQALFKLFYAERSVNTMLHGKEISKVRRAHALIYTVLYGYLTAKLFECNLGKPCNDGKFTINSSLQTLKELIKDTHEDTTSCTI